MKKKRSRLGQLSHFCFGSEAAFILSVEIILGLVLSAAFLFIFFHLTNEVLEKEILAYDIALSKMVYSLRTPFLTQVMIVISFLGVAPALATTALISIFLLIKHHRKEAVLFSLTLIIGFILNIGLKSLTHRVRPLISPLVIERSYSFPSGHAMNAFIFYSLLAYFSHHFIQKRNVSHAIIILSSVLILLVGVSRVYLGVHYPSDVVAGYIAGFVVFMMALVLEWTFVFFKLFKKPE